MTNNNYKWILEENNDFKDKVAKDIVDSILEKRGIVDKKEKELFLHPKLENMHHPMKLNDMEKAVKRILASIDRNEQITIYGDYDVDGITSTAILYLFLKDNNSRVNYYIPDRTKEGYGLNKEAIKEIREGGSDLVITVDTGIAAIEEVAYANEIGLDVIITDHHECPENLPKALAVINPKRLDSTYPFKELAGVGVAFKLIHALALTLDNVETIWKYIDIVAVGTVADIVPLVDENRIIVRNAFTTIPNTWNLGLESLLKVSGFKSGKISSGTIGFQIGPRINAAGRLGDAKLAVRLFTSNNREEALEIAEKLDKENRERKEIEQDIFEEALGKIEKNANIKRNNIIVVGGKGWHKGVIGIVASRLSEKYYKPCIVFSITDELATGSARSIAGFSIYEAISKAGHLTSQFGGHSMAAGISAEANNLKAFTKEINTYADTVMTKDILTKKIKIDSEISEDQVNLETIEKLEKLEPYGVGNPTPVFAYKGSIYSKQMLGKASEHLKLQIKTNNKLIDSIGFSMKAKGQEVLEGDLVRLACNLQKNEWQGKITPQLIVRDIKLSEKVIRQGDYYLSLYKKMPNPSYNNIKEFTNAIKICYIKSYKTYNIKENKDFYKEQFSKLLPTREDVASIYRYIRNLENSNRNSMLIHTLTRALNEANVSEYKVLQVLDILLELKLIEYEYKASNRRVEFKLLKGNTNPLKNSNKFLNLSSILKEGTRQ